MNAICCQEGKLHSEWYFNCVANTEKRERNINKKFHYGFGDVEKVHDRVPRDIMW